MPHPVPSLTRDSIQRAHTTIQPYIHQTPLLTSRSLTASTGQGNNQLLFKAENLQKGGAFKARGAFFNVHDGIKEEERQGGVCTHSSGNHAGCLALASRSLQIPCHLVMPSNSSPAKISASRSYGANITFCEPTAPARQAMLEKVQKKTGAIFVPPYDAERTIVGQGTVWLEVEAQVRAMGIRLEDLGAVVVPVGGGGLLAGVCIAAEASGVPVYGAEPAGADDCARGIASGVRVEGLVPNTIADGLRTPVGVLNFPIIKKHVKGILTVTETEILTAQRLLLERLKTLVEPSGAVSFAAVRSEGFQRLGIKGPVVMVLSGGNVDLEKPFGWMTE
ncbi:tryptophan synthase beta subunit-like PLP-dependent enzyme [Leucosporidium creatinivorum]|uniref:Serine racemase n=1 Tax=Leucosporidium creatinivorum TaxID=106004 RepID=A0A1Y2FWZ6_9BASI|nr:tryptophan synthase beta subunit-like PLP-dependent enzyme [Leucosporidium creatinivorum]